MFDFRTFDCIWLANVLGEVNYVQLPNPIKVDQTIGVQLSLIAESVIDRYA